MAPPPFGLFISKVFSALIMVLPKLISGTPGLVSCTEAKRRANVTVNDDQRACS